VSSLGHLFTSSGHPAFLWLIPLYFSTKGLTQGKGETITAVDSKWSKRLRVQLEAARTFLEDGSIHFDNIKIKK
jgi:hypothetical protein